jgi:hypothetical protein
VQNPHEKAYTGGNLSPSKWSVHLGLRRTIIIRIHIACVFRRHCAKGFWAQFCLMTEMTVPSPRKSLPCCKDAPLPSTQPSHSTLWVPRSIPLKSQEPRLGLARSMFLMFSQMTPKNPAGYLVFNSMHQVSVYQLWCARLPHENHIPMVVLAHTVCLLLLLKIFIKAE